jgi:hypothetical protein
MFMKHLYSIAIGGVIIIIVVIFVIIMIVYRNPKNGCLFLPCRLVILHGFGNVLDTSGCHFPFLEQTLLLV